MAALGAVVASAVLVLGACGGDGSSVGLSASSDASGDEDGGVGLPADPAPPSTEVPPPPSTTERSGPGRGTKPVRSVTTLTAPTVPTVPPLPEPIVPLPTTTTSTSPLPVPELFDARQGVGTPCESEVEQHPEGCFFFVYATPATKGLPHRVYSDAPFRTEYTVSTGDCGPASPHHADRSGCVFYIGSVHDRVAGRQECFWATTVTSSSGGPESAPSNRVCFTWTDQPPP